MELLFQKNDYSSINIILIMQLLINEGFNQMFPFVDQFQKRINDTCAINVHTSYLIKRTDISEDYENGVFYYKITVINLPNKETKIFKKIENALKYIKNV